jgi:hypothetical protein
MNSVRRHMRATMFLAGLATTTLFVGCSQKPPVHQTQSPVFGNCINGLKIIRDAKALWAADHPASPSAIPTMDDLIPCLGVTTVGKPDSDVSWLHCPEGGNYTTGRVDELPRCSIPQHSLDFGYVVVVDEAGSPMPGATVSVRAGPKDVYSSRTGKDGIAGVAPWQASMIDAWYARTNEIAVAKEGYRTEMLTNPTSWPLRFTLKKEGN